MPLHAIPQHAYIRCMTLEQFKSERGLKLVELAVLFGDRPVSTVHGWLKGTRKPGVVDAQMIENATGGAVTVAVLLPELAAAFQQGKTK